MGWKKWRREEEKWKEENFGRIHCSIHGLICVFIAIVHRQVTEVKISDFYFIVGCESRARRALFAVWKITHMYKHNYCEQWFDSSLAKSCEFSCKTFNYSSSVPVTLMTLHAESLTLWRRMQRDDLIQSCWLRLRISDFIVIKQNDIDDTNHFEHCLYNSNNSIHFFSLQHSNWIICRDFDPLLAAMMKHVYVLSADTASLSEAWREATEIASVHLLARLCVTK